MLILLILPRLKNHMTCSFFFSSRRRHTRCYRDWSSDVCSSDLTWARFSRSFDGECCLEAQDLAEVVEMAARVRREPAPAEAMLVREPIDAGDGTTQDEGRLRHGEDRLILRLDAHDSAFQPIRRSRRYRGRRIS